MRVFISYRREDTGGYAIAVYKDLGVRLEENHQVFMDIDTIDAGADFINTIEAALDRCDAVLVLIGNKWLSATDDDGRRRLDSERDFVRLEIRAALRRDVRVIPVLVNQASMPRRRELPEDLRPLARRNALEIRNTRFDADMDQLVDALQSDKTRGSKHAAVNIARKLVGRGGALLKRSPFLAIGLVLSLLAVLAVSNFPRRVFDAVSVTAYLPSLWRSESHLIDPEDTRIRAMRARLTDRLIAAGDNMRKPGATEDAWNYADVLVGLAHDDLGRLANGDHVEFLMEQVKPDDECWVQGQRTPSERDTCHLAATAWVLLALGYIGAPAPEASWSLVLQQQQRQGWWALYQSVDPPEKYASTYATALLALAMQIHSEKGLIPSSIADVVKAEIVTARTWLANVQSPDGCYWPDYPYDDLQARKDIRAISGIVLYVLGRLNYSGFSETCGECLRTLTSEYPPLDSTETNSVIEFLLDDGSTEPDAIDHLDVVWSGMGVWACRPHAGAIERLRSRAFISRSLVSGSARPDQRLRHVWAAAEANLFLRTVTTGEAL